MNIDVKKGNIIDFEGDAIVVNIFKGTKEPKGGTGAVDKILSGEISRVLENFEGKLGDVYVLNTFGRIKTKFVLIAGLGEKEKFSIEGIRKVQGSVVKKMSELKIKKAGSILHGGGEGNINLEKAASAFAEGSILGNYSFDKYKSDEKKEDIEITIIEMDDEKIKDIKRGIEEGKIKGRCQNIVRDFVNEPPNELTPLNYAKNVENILKELNINNKVITKIYYKNDMEKMGMNALLSVGKGSANEPVLIVLKNRDSKERLVSIIGKGITFDSGGINIKTGEGIRHMKGDMAGSAVVFGAFIYAVLSSLDINVMCIIPAVENMPSGTASRPGDVVYAMNGKSIEIISTDAEGRMILADSICYAEKEGSEYIIDIATLTGGSFVAFGDVAGCMMGSKEIVEIIRRNIDITGEKIWEMPLFEEYREKMKS
jgi:leucyl aminopeptidase